MSTLSPIAPFRLALPAQPRFAGPTGHVSAGQAYSASQHPRFDKAVDQVLFKQLLNHNFIEADALIRHQGADVNAKNNRGYTMLHYFAFKNKAVPHNLLKLQIMLRQYGADVNATDKDGKTVLHTAVQNNDHQLLEFLLEQPDLNLAVQDSKGLSPLGTAITLQNGDMSLRLSQAARTRKSHKRELTEGERSTTNHKPLNALATSFEPRTSDNKKNNVKDEHGNTPIHWAALSGDIEKVLKVKAESGADINTPNDFGNTALHWVSTLNNPEFFRQMVIQGGANPNVKNNQGFSPVDEKPKSGVDFWPILPWKK